MLVNVCTCAGAFPGDEEVFASVQVNYVGQPIGLIVADSDHLARAATKCVQIDICTCTSNNSKTCLMFFLVYFSCFSVSVVAVTYAPATTAPIVTIEQAIAANSYLLPNQYIIQCYSFITSFPFDPVIIRLIHTFLQIRLIHSFDFMRRCRHCIQKCTKQIDWRTACRRPIPFLYGNSGFN